MKPNIFIGIAHRLENGNLVALGCDKTTKNNIEQKNRHCKKDSGQKGNLNAYLLDFISNKTVRKLLTPTVGSK